MRFTNLAVLSLSAPVAWGFVAPGAKNFAFRPKALSAFDDADFSSLESKLLGSGGDPKADAAAAKATEKAAAKRKAELAAAEKKAEAAKKAAEKEAAAQLKAAAKAEAAAAKKVPEPTPAPKAAPAPKPAPASKVAPAPKPAPAPKAAPAPKPAKKVVTPPPPKPLPKPSKPADGTTVAEGVALGAAPLVVAPLLALGAGRDLLTKTAANRQKIQDEIAAKEAAAKKAKLGADVDAGGITTAVVS